MKVLSVSGRGNREFLVQSFPSVSSWEGLGRRREALLLGLRFKALLIRQSSGVFIASAYRHSSSVRSERTCAALTGPALDKALFGYFRERTN